MSYDFGTVGVGEHRYYPFLFKPRTGSPTIAGVDLSLSSGMTVLSPTEASSRGYVPCDGIVNTFCVVVVRLDATSIGSRNIAFSLRVGDVNAPNNIQIMGSFQATGTVQSAPTVYRDHFTTVSVRAKAQAAGMTPRVYLQNEFDKMKPTSFIASNTDIHNPAYSDALIFSSYGSSTDPVQWRQNWTNSVFDLTNVAWDTYGGTAPDFLGPFSQGGAAITRCHIATAKHYPRGGGFTFHTRTGTPNWFNITGEADLPSYDVKIYRIDPCLPADFTVYQLLDPADLAAGVDLATAPYITPAFNVIDYIRRISIVQLAYMSPFGTGGDFNTTLPASMQVIANSGDSGSPTFIYFDGKLVLLSTLTYGNTYGGSGPSYSDGTFQSQLTTAIAALPPP